MIESESIHYSTNKNLINLPWSTSVCSSTFSWPFAFPLHVLIYQRDQLEYLQTDLVYYVCHIVSALDFVVDLVSHYQSRRAPMAWSLQRFADSTLWRVRKVGPLTRKVLLTKLLLQCIAIPSVLWINAKFPEGEFAPAVVPRDSLVLRILAPSMSLEFACESRWKVYAVYLVFTVLQRVMLRCFFRIWHFAIETRAFPPHSLWLTVAFLVFSCSVYIGYLMPTMSL